MPYCFRSCALLIFLNLCATCRLVAGNVIHLSPFAEPREHAFTMLIPDGWITQGGIYRVDPSRAGGAGNSITAKLDFTVKRDAPGTAMTHTFPDLLYMDMRRSPAAAMFPPGSNYNGMLVSPVMNAQTYLTQMVFRREHPQARNVKTLVQAPLPQVAASYDQMAHAMGLPADYRHDAALLVADYDEAGGQFREVLYTAVEQMMGGMWGNKDTYLARAPVNEFDAMRPVFEAMRDSVKPDNQWMAREAQNQAVRSNIVRDVQSTVQRIDAEIVAHRQRTNAAMNSEMQLLLTDKTTAVDPHTGKTKIIPNEGNSRFFGKNGDLLISDDPNFDPEKQPKYANKGYERAK
jgi:hypothetical protein